MPPPPISPDQILEYAPRQKARIVQVDANVAAYFGDLFRDLRTGLREGALNNSTPSSKNLQGFLHKGPSNTAGAQSRS
jgi:hypothetical protein